MTVSLIYNNIGHLQNGTETGRVEYESIFTITGKIQQILFLETKPPKTIAVHRSFEAEKPKIITNVGRPEPQIETSFQHRPIETEKRQKENAKRPNEIEKRERETERPKIRNHESKLSPTGNPITFKYKLVQNVRCRCVI